MCYAIPEKKRNTSLFIFFSLLNNNIYNIKN